MNQQCSFDNSKLVFGLFRDNLKSIREQLLSGGIQSSRLKDLIKKEIIDVGSKVSLDSLKGEMEKAIRKVKIDIKALFGRQISLEDSEIATYLQYNIYNKDVVEEQDVSTGRLEKHDEAEERITRFNDDYLNSAYGDLAAAKLEARMLAQEVTLNSAIFRNGKTKTSNKFIVLNDDELNQEIRKQQQYLLDKVVKFLREKYAKMPDILAKYPNIFTTPKMYDIDEKGNLKYTGIVEEIEKAFGDELSAEKFSYEYLDSLYHKVNSTKVPTTEIQYAKLEIDAYHNWVLLNHFEDAFNANFGKSLVIKSEYATFSPYNKYSMSSKASNMNATWRNKEEIDLDKEINNIVLLLVTLVPIYKVGSTSAGVTHLKFNEFCYIICKIKDLVYSSKNANYQLTEDEINSLSPRSQRILREHSISKLEKTLLEDAQSFETLRKAFLLSAETENLAKYRPEDLIEVIKDNDLIADKVFEVLEGFNFEYMSEGISFIDLINSLRDNPQKYMPVILDILDTPATYNSLILNGVFDSSYLLDIDRTLLHSMNVGLFSEKVPNSLYSINKRSGFNKKNYYSYVTLVVDSMFNNNYLQYYRDTDGNIYLRNMFDQTLNNIRRNLEQGITTANSKRLINYLDIIKKYLVLDIYKPSVDKNSNTFYNTGYRGKEIRYPNYFKNISGDLVLSIHDDGSYEYFKEYEVEGHDKSLQKKRQPVSPSTVNFTQLRKLFEKIDLVRFIVPQFLDTIEKGPISGDLLIYVYPGGSISYYLKDLDNNVSPLNGFSSERAFRSLLPFLLEVLKLNLEEDVDFLEALKNIYVNNGITQWHELTGDLMKLASHVLFNQFVSNKSLIDPMTGEELTTQYDIKKRLKGIYGTNIPSYNKSLRELNLVTDADSVVLRRLSRAKAMASGLLTASLIKDGNGNSQASTTLSRLLGAIPEQWTMLNRNADSASKDFHILKNGVVKQIYTCKELKDAFMSTAKAHIDMNNSEVETACIKYDFLQGFVEEDSTNPIKNGVISIIPSVNADKGTIGRLLIDLKAPITYIDSNTGEEVTAEGGLYSIIYKDGKFDLDGINTAQEICGQELSKFYKKSQDNINKVWDKIGTEVLGLLKGTLSNTEIGFKNLKQFISQKSQELGKQLKVKDYIMGEISKYNQNHPNTPIVLIDQVHYCTDPKTGDLVVNPTFEGLMKRFGSIDRTYEFFEHQETSVFKNLLKDKFEITIDPNPLEDESKENAILRKALIEDGHTVDSNTDWVDDRTHRMIIGSIFRMGHGSTGISTELELKNYAEENGIPGNTVDEIITNIELSKDFEITLNPILRAYNTINYMYGSEWRASTVGSHFAHPNKKFGVSLLMDEAARYNASNKRNVSYTAAMHAFLKKLLNGIPEDYNIAIVDDITDSQYNVVGDVDKVKPHDGAVFVNPFIVFLENNALGGALAGVNKKQFVHFYNEQTGTGGIIKCAGFGITNDLMRNSKFYRTMMWNMTNRIWRQKNGQPIDLDITKDYLGNPILYTGETKDSTLYYFDDKDGQYYAIDRIEKAEGVNKYNIHRRRVNEHGQPDPRLDENNEVVDETIMGKTINSNYALWQTFGGYNSMELKDGEDTLTPSENSIKAVVNAMNNIGIVKPGVNPKEVETLDDIYQPLKHSDIHYMPTAGAVKLGAGNINSTQWYNKRHELTSTGEILGEGLNFMKIHMNQAGIQLDKEHNADNEELSMMTQVISSCTARGYTPAQATAMYEALSSLAYRGVKEYADNFREFFQDPNGSKEVETGLLNNDGTKKKITVSKSDAFLEVITNTIIDALVHGSNQGDVLALIARKLIEKAQKGKEIKFADAKGVIPYSDNSVFRKLVSTINVVLTKSSIKTKIPGVLAVLCPSYNIMKLYGDRKLESYKDLNELETRQKEEFDKIDYIENPSGIEIGRTYKCKRANSDIEEKIEVKTSRDYYNLRKQIEPEHNEIIVTNIPDISAKVKEVNGINTLRRFDTPFHFGNPFSHNPNWGIQVKTVRDAVDAYRAWLRGDSEFVDSEFKVIDLTQVDPKRRQWILDQIQSGALDNKPLIYYTTKIPQEAEFNGYNLTTYDATLAPHHAHVLNEFIYQSKVDRRITSVVEDITEGRELASFNVRFSGTIIKPKVEKIEGVEPSEMKQKILGNPTDSWMNRYKRALKLIGSYLPSFDPGEATQLEDFVQLNLPMLDPKLFKEETGYSPNVGFLRTYFRTKENGGVSIKTAAESIYADLPESLLGQYNDLDIRNAIIDMFLSAQSPNDIKYARYIQAINEGLGNYENEYYAAEEEAALHNMNNSGELGSLRNYNLYDLDSIRYLTELKERGNVDEDSLTTATRLVQEDLAKLSTTNSKGNQIVRIGGRLVEVDASTIVTQPYEVIMPKIFATIFGLEKYDSVDLILSEGPLFFAKRLSLNFKPLIPDSDSDVYDIELKRINGKHIYLLDRSNLGDIKDRLRLKSISIESKDGKIYRVDKNGKRLYLLSVTQESLNNGKILDLVYEYELENGKFVEVIVTENPIFYLNKFKYNTVNISSKFGKKKAINAFNNIYSYINRSKNSAAKQYCRDIKELADSMIAEKQVTIDSLARILACKNLENAIINYNPDDLTKSKIRSIVENISNKLFTSFKRSLDIVAARIPAQSMQSFMPMKVIGFDNPDVNTAYVSTAQIWLQGSDYDIDAVSLAAFAFDRNGNFITWSPYADINSEENLKASESFPFPTNQKVKIVREGNSLDYLSLIDTPFDTEPNPTSLFSFSEAKRDWEFVLDMPRDIRQRNGISDAEYIKRTAALIDFVNKNGLVPPNPSVMPANNPIIKRDMAIKLFNKIQEVVNRHNLYLDSVDEDNQEGLIKNFMMSKMYGIINDPINLIEAQSPIDKQTEPLKAVANSSSKAKEQDEANPGDFTTNIHGIVENQTGKKGVGICAVGLKSFFALTEYYNSILNNGTEEQLKYLPFDVTILGKNYNMLANVRKENIEDWIDVNTGQFKNPDFIDNNNIVGLLKGVNNDRDAALVLSALLSLATDNAKELALAKLNAGTNMLGMYIYGISIGMDFRDVSEILMSDIGFEINSMMLGNSFNEEYGLNIQDIFDYFELGPSKLLRQFDVPGRRLLANGDVEYTDQTPKRRFILELKKVLGEDEIFKKFPTYSNKDCGGIIHALATNWSREKLHEIIEHLRNKEGYLGLETQTHMYYKLLDFVEQYAEQLEMLEDSTISRDGRTYLAYSELKQLSYGAEELKVLGQLLHLNQGLYTTVEDTLNLVDNIENCIRTKALNLNREYRRQHQSTDDYLPERFDLNSFLNDSEKQEELVAEYDQYKTSFNLLDVIRTVPHFRSYLEVANEANQALLKTSAKYRALYNLKNPVLEEIGATSSKDKKAVLKRLEGFVNDYMRKLWMVDTRLQIKIPEGCYIYPKTTEGTKILTDDNEYQEVLDGAILVKNPSGAYIQLGTREGDASFKRFMEQKVIPDLKKGIVDESGVPSYAILNNKFILGLSSSINSRTPNFTTVVGYSLPINMCPRSESELKIFDDYKYSFNQLKTTGTPRYRGYDIVELFFYYNQIAFQGKVGENTLTSIFQNSREYRNLGRYFDYINQFDELQDIRLDQDVSLEELVRQCAPMANPRGTNLKHFYSLEKSTNTMAYWTAVDDDLIQDEYDGTGSLDVNGYSPEILDFVNGSKENFFFTKEFENTNIESEFSVAESDEFNRLSLKDYRIKINHAGNRVLGISLESALGEKEEINPLSLTKEQRKVLKTIPTEFRYIDGSLHLVYNIEPIVDVLKTIKTNEKNPC